jgi:hypothetical protein
VFYITCGVYIAGSIIYGLFTTATVQPWALTEASENSTDEIDRKKKDDLELNKK